MIREEGQHVTWEHNRLNSDADGIVLFIHGMNCSALTLRGLIDLIDERLPNAEILVPSVPLKWNNFVDLRTLSREMAVYLAKILDRRPIKQVVIAGHSAGGVLAQSVCLDLHDEDIKLDSLKLRLILIAPMTKGWQITHHLPLSAKVSWFLGVQLSKALRGWEMIHALTARRDPRPLWILQLQRGSQFLVELRLRWLKAKREKKVTNERLETTTLLGSVDEIISWRDMVDEVLGANVRYVQVPFSNHAEIVRVQLEKAEKDDPKAQEICDTRGTMICDAIAGNHDSPAVSFEPWDDPPPPVKPNVKRVVFVIHGIRDVGHWTQKIAARARNLYAGNPDDIAVETSSYGFFSMLEFLNPNARLKKIHWLMDEYVEARRRYPNPECKFSFIGHSNGTYLLAQALKDYKEVEFERIAFAGSVVTSKYDWDTVRHRKPGIKYVLNFRGKKDWVVSFFPRAAQIFPPLGLLVGKNLGGAGVLPFKEDGEAVRNSGYLDGGHGVAIQEENWDNLARFAVSTEEPPPHPEFQQPTFDEPPAKRAMWVFGRMLGKLTTPLVLLGIIACVVGLGWLAWINPPLLWIVPIISALLGVVLGTHFGTKADGCEFEQRTRWLNKSKWVMVATASLIATWVLLPIVLRALVWLQWEPWPQFLGWWRYGFSELLSGWNSQVLGAIRMFSLTVYIWLLRRVLTKV